jgi:hypothetical protein
MNPLQIRLAALRRRLRLLVTFRGVCCLLGFVLLTAALAGLFDWYVHCLSFDLPRLTRALFLVAGLGGAGLIGYGLLFRPLWAKADDLTLALRIEARYPALNDSLASTVQFLEQPADSDRSGSPGLRREAVRRALRQAKTFDFNKVIEVRWVRLAGLGLVIGLALASSLFWLNRAAALTALARLVNPFGGPAWPPQTELALDYPRQIASGETFELHGKLKGVIPETVTVEFDGITPAQEESKVAVSEDRKEGSLRGIKRETKWNQGNFRFQVRANDAVSGWQEVRVLPPPKLALLDGRPSPQIALRYPTYTDLPAEKLPAGTGKFEAVAGTRVTLRAATDRPVARAWIEYLPADAATVPASAFATLAAQQPSDLLPLLAGGRDVWGRTNARLEQGGQVFTIDCVPPRILGEYALHVEDDLGLGSSRRYDLRIFSDPAPVVNLERPSASLDRLELLPGAEITVQVLAEDQQYALRSVYLEHQTRHARDAVAEEGRPPSRLSLYDHGTLATIAPGLLSALAATPVPVPPCDLRPRPQRLQIARRWSLRELDLKPGDVLALQACADDFDDVTAGKQPGRSHELEIRIVSLQELQARLEKDQAQVHKELLNLHKLEKEALEKVLEVEQRWRNTGRLRPEDVHQLVEAEQLQQQIRSRVGTQDEEGLRGEVRRTLDAMHDNHLPRSAAQQRMEMVAAELKRLADEELEQIEPRLTEARKQNETSPPGRKPPKEERGPLGEARQHQEEVENTLNELLARLQSLSELPDVQGEAKALRDAQQRLNDRVEDLKRQLPIGLDRDELAPEQRADLDQVAAAQEKLRERLDQLLNRMDDSVRKKAEEARERMERAREQIDQARRNERDEPTRRLLEEAAEALERASRDLDRDKQQQLEQARDRMRAAQAEGLSPEQRKQLLEDAAKALQRADEIAKEKQQQLRRAEDQVRRAQEQPQQKPATGDKLDEAAKALQEAAEREEQAQPLERASSVGKSGQPTEQMKEAAKQIRANKPGKAGDQQQKATDTLQKLVKELEEHRQFELDELRKKLAEAEGKMDELAKRQDDLRKEIQKARQNPDPEKRAEELKRLARKQEQLRKETQDLLRELSRLRATRAAQALGQAASQMEQQARQLERGEQPEDSEQEEMLDRLNEAQEQLEQARQEVEEELAREKLAKVAEVIQRLKERHEGMIAEHARLQRSAVQLKKWDKLLRAGLDDLSKDQKALGEETSRLTEKELAKAEVFVRMLQKAAKAMEQAGDEMERHRGQVQENPEQTAPDEATVKLQEEAKRRLEQVLEALKPDRGGARRPSKQGGGGEGGQPNAGQNGAPNDGIPPLAQLRLLRALQNEVNQRTDAFSKQHPDPKKLTEQEKKELQDLSREQQEVADLLEKLTSAEVPEGDKQ